MVVAATLSLAALAWVASVGAQSAPAPAASATVPVDVLTVAAGEQLLMELDTSLIPRHTQPGEHVYFTNRKNVVEYGFRIDLDLTSGEVRLFAA